MVRQRWRYTFHFKDLLRPEDVNPEIAHEIGQKLAARIQRRPSIWGDEAEELIERFQDVDDQDQFNEVLSDMYDIADTLGIWLGLR